VRVRRSCEAGATPDVTAGKPAFQLAAFRAGRRRNVSMSLVLAVRISTSCCSVLLIANPGDYPLGGRWVERTCVCPARLQASCCSWACVPTAEKKWTLLFQSQAGAQRGIVPRSPKRPSRRQRAEQERGANRGRRGWGRAGLWRWERVGEPALGCRWLFSSTRPVGDAQRDFRVGSAGAAVLHGSGVGFAGVTGGSGRDQQGDGDGQSSARRKTPAAGFLPTLSSARGEGSTFGRDLCEL